MKKIFTNWFLIKKNFKLAAIASVVAFSQIQDLNAQVGATIQFDGVGDYVNLGSALTTSLNGGKSITIEAWVNTATNQGTTAAGVVSNYNTSAAGGLSLLLRREGTQYSFWVGNGGTWLPCYTPVNTSTIGVWQHIAGVWDGTVSTVYVNGAVSSTSVTSGISSLQSSNANAVYIGSNIQNNESFSGMIDEVRIWSTARTQCQINTYMNCEIPTNAAGLMANYHFNQGVASGNNAAVTTLTDACTTANTGTLVGIALSGATSNWVAPGGVVSGFTTALAAPGYTNSALSICPGGTVVLGSNGATSYTWSAGVTNNVAFTPTSSVSYTYAGTNSISTCSNVAVASITLNPLPNLTVTTSNSIICGPPFQGTANLTASGASTYTWSTVSTNTTIAVSPTVTTNYTVAGTSAAGCMNAIVVTQSVSTCTGLNELAFAGSDVIVYPNPTTGNLNVSGNIGSVVNVYNLLGKLCLTHQLQSSTTILNLSELSTGVYFIQIGTVTKKIIKE